MPPPPDASQSLAATREKRQTRPSARVQEMMEQQEEREQEREQERTRKARAKKAKPKPQPKPKETPAPKDAQGDDFMYGPAECFIEPTLVGDTALDRERYDTALADYILRLLAHRGDGDWSAHYAKGGPVDLQLLQRARDYPGAQIIERALEEAELEDAIKAKVKGKARAVDLDDQAALTITSGERPSLYSGITYGRPTPTVSTQQDCDQPFLGYPSRSLTRSRSPPGTPPPAKKPRSVIGAAAKPAVQSASLGRPVVRGATSNQPQAPPRKKTSYGGPATNLKLLSSGSRPFAPARVSEPNKPNKEPTRPMLTNPTRLSPDHDLVPPPFARRDDRPPERSPSPPPAPSAPQKQELARPRIPWPEPILEFIPQPSKRVAPTNKQVGRASRPVPPLPTDVSASRGDENAALAGSRTGKNPRPVPPPTASTAPRVTSGNTLAVKNPRPVPPTGSSSAPTTSRAAVVKAPASKNPRPIPPPPLAGSAGAPTVSRVALVNALAIKRPRPMPPPPVPPNGSDLSADGLPSLDARPPRSTDMPRPARARLGSPRPAQPRPDKARVNNPSIGKPKVIRPRVDKSRANPPTAKAPRGDDTQVNRVRVEIPRANKTRGKTQGSERAKHRAPSNRRDARSPHLQPPQPQQPDPRPTRQDLRPQDRRPAHDRAAAQPPRGRRSPPRHRSPPNAQQPQRPLDPDGAQARDGAELEGAGRHGSASEDEDHEAPGANRWRGPVQRVSNRPTIGSFPLREQRTITLMARKAKAWIIACGTFGWAVGDAGAHVPSVEEIVAQAFAEACQEHGRVLHFDADHVICVQNLVTTYRTSVKLIIVALVKLRMGFVTGAKAYNRALVKWLVPDAFHELFPEGNGDRHPFESPFIYEAVACVLFDPGLLGIKHAGRFNPVPLRFLAFICSVCNHVIKCYRRGHFDSKEHLKASIREGAFRGYLQLLSDMVEARGFVLRDICILMYEQALTNYRKANQEVPEAREARQWDPDVPARPQQGVDRPAPAPRNHIEHEEDDEPKDHDVPEQDGEPEDDKEPEADEEPKDVEEPNGDEEPEDDEEPQDDEQPEDSEDDHQYTWRGYPRMTSAREGSLDDGTNRGEGPSRPYGIPAPSSDDDELPSFRRVVAKYVARKMVVDDKTDEPSDEEMDEE